MAQFSGSTYSAAVDEAKRLIALATFGNTQVDMSDYYSKTDSDNKFAAKVDLDTLTTSVNDKINKTDIVDNLTSTDTDKPLSANQGKVLKDEIDLKANDNDVVKKTDIVTTIDSSSTNDTVPTAKAVNELNIRGTLIDQSVIDKYGTEIIKYPLGRWCFNSSSLARQFSDIPWAEACIIDITSISNIGNPWDNAWSCRNYKAQTVNMGTFVRQLESRDTAGVLYDTGWQRVCTTSVADVPLTSVTIPDGLFQSVNEASYIKYEVVNGIAFVYFSIRECRFASSSKSMDIIVPKFKNPFQHMIVGETVETVISILADGNVMQLWTLGNENTVTNYLGCISYPVAES